MSMREKSVERLGAVEAGGTKFVCAVADDSRQIRDLATIPTGTPLETFAAVRAFFERHLDGGRLDGLGIASFGPAIVDPAAAGYGSIAATPKPGWQGADIRAALGDLAGRFAFDTDVNGAALGEARYGAGQGLRTVAYVTVGTGIGVGVVQDGRALIGQGHYEMGHVPVFHDRAADPFEGVCPFHGNCAEGLASGPAVKARWGRSLSDLPPDHAAHDLIAVYLASLCQTVLLSHAPDVIVLGGGVMKTPGLLARIGEKLGAIDSGYLSRDVAAALAAPGLADRSGITGALELASGTTGRE